MSSSGLELVDLLLFLGGGGSGVHIVILVAFVVVRVVGIAGGSALRLSSLCRFGKLLGVFACKRGVLDLKVLEFVDDLLDRNVCSRS